MPKVRLSEELSKLRNKIKDFEKKEKKVKELLHAIIVRGCVEEKHNQYRCIFCWRDLRFEEHMKNCLYMKCAHFLGISDKHYGRKRRDTCPKDLNLNEK